MAGIYIHIPFCKQKCIYCNFHFSTNLRIKKQLLQAIHHEITLKRNYAANEPIETIYFGGGTPSILEVEELHEILKRIYDNFEIAPNPEVTLEANPDNLSPALLVRFAKIGINRLSIGIQSFNNTDLQFMNRAHNAAQAMECVPWARQAGIDNISVDLIFGIPNQTQKTFEENLVFLAKLNPPHFSAYALTVEPRTHLNHLVKKKKLTAATDEIFEERYFRLLDFSAENNFINYEISNYCRDENFARHNTAYWQGKPYIGLGPSAHSFDGRTRQWNVANNFAYTKGVLTHGAVGVPPTSAADSSCHGELAEPYYSALRQAQGDKPFNLSNNGGAPPTTAPYFELETLTHANKFNEYILTKLRTIWGVDLAFIKDKFGEDYLQHLTPTISKYLLQKRIYKDGDKIFLTREGKLMADGIAAEMFVEE
ncbi:MAG: radical SAM family heme chaperone HemW [Bacteroidetes bacterium]|nr:radical SAM family heme chaperone HemW [Bacteroidota bacterium]